MSKITADINYVFNEDLESLKGYYTSVLTNLAETEKSLKKKVNELILFVLMYFIIIQSSIKEINIGPFQINNLSIIIQIFPLILAYKLYEYIRIQSFRTALVKVVNRVVQKLYPRISERSLSDFIKAESIVGVYIFSNSDFRGKASNLINSIQLMISVFQFILLPIAIISYSVFVSFSRFGFSNIFVWVILTFVLILVTQCFLLFGDSAEFQ